MEARVWRAIGPVLILLVMLASRSFVQAGCLYDSRLGDYTCGDHGECKQVKMADRLVFRYCLCERGYEGADTCNQKCDDCCEQLAEQCYNKRIRNMCKLPRCLGRALSNKRCRSDSKHRPAIVSEMERYQKFCLTGS